MSQDSASLGCNTGEVVGESASEQCAVEGEVAVVGTVVAGRGDLTCGGGDPSQLRDGGEASKPGGKDKAAA